MKIICKQKYKKKLFIFQIKGELFAVTDRAFLHLIHAHLYQLNLFITSTSLSHLYSYTRIHKQAHTQSLNKQKANEATYRFRF